MDPPVLICLIWILSIKVRLSNSSGKVNCANYQQSGLSIDHNSNGFMYLAETPSGGDKSPGLGYVVGDHGTGGADGQCLITIVDTTVNNQQSNHKTPSSSCSAFAITPIGNYLLYGTAAPYKGIAAYAIDCRGLYPISEDMLFLPTDYYIQQIAISHSGSEHYHHSTSLIVTLNVGALPTAFEIMTSGDRFRLSHCITTFPHAHATDVGLIDRNKATIVVFSNNNLDTRSQSKDRYAPIYISAYNQRNATLCGYVPVEHTKKVELWLDEGNIIATFVQQMPERKRSFIRWFTIKIIGKSCKAEPWVHQTVMGALPWETGLSVLPPGNPSLLFPFTIDNILCGVEDIKIIQTSSFTALVVAIANSDNCLENSCATEDLLTFEQSNSAGTVRICGCAYAIKNSFAILLDKATHKFALDITKPTSFQTLKPTAEMVTEIQTVLLPCCALVQLCSTTGSCELFTLRIDQRTQEFDAARISGTRLPIMIESSAIGICKTNTVAVSYSGVEPGTKPNIHIFSCTNFHDGNYSPDEPPRYHLALYNGTGVQIPVSDSLPGNRRHTATPFYVRPPMQSPAGDDPTPSRIWGMQGDETSRITVGQMSSGQSSPRAILADPYASTQQVPGARPKQLFPEPSRLYGYGNAGGQQQYAVYQSGSGYGSNPRFSATFNQPR